MKLLAFTVVVSGFDSLIVLVSFIVLAIIGHILTKKAEKAGKRSRARIISYKVAKELSALKHKSQQPLTEETLKKKEEIEEDLGEEIEERHLVSLVAREHLDTELDEHHLLTEVESHHLRLDIPDLQERRRRASHDPLAFARRFPPAVQMVLFHELLSRRSSSHTPFCLHPAPARLTSNKGRRKEGGKEYGADE